MHTPKLLFWLLTLIQYNDKHSESAHVWPHFQCLQTLLVDTWSVRWCIWLQYLPHLISQYICPNVAPAGKHYSLFFSGQAGIANHWPVFGGVPWCHPRLGHVQSGPDACSTKLCSLYFYCHEQSNKHVLIIHNTQYVIHQNCLELCWRLYLLWCFLFKTCNLV